MALCSPTVAGVIAENNVNNVVGPQFNSSHINVYPQDVRYSVEFPLPCEIMSEIRVKLAYPKKFRIFKTVDGNLEKTKLNLNTARAMLEKLQPLLEDEEYRKYRDLYTTSIKRYNYLVSFATSNPKGAASELKKETLEIRKFTKKLVDNISISSENGRDKKLFRTESLLQLRDA